MTSFYIRGAEVEDAEEIGRLNYAAYGFTNVLYQAFFQNELTVVMPKAFRAAIEKGNGPCIRLAVDKESGKILGYCRYQLKEATDLDEKKDDDDKKDAEGKEEEQPPSLEAQLYKVKDHLLALWKQLGKNGEEMEETYKKAASGKKHYCKFPAGKN